MCWYIKEKGESIELEKRGVLYVCSFKVIGFIRVEWFLVLISDIRELLIPDICIFSFQPYYWLFFYPLSDRFVSSTFFEAVVLLEHLFLNWKRKPNHHYQCLSPTKKRSRIFHKKMSFQPSIQKKTSNKCFYPIEESN